MLSLLDKGMNNKGRKRFTTNGCMKAGQLFNILSVPNRLPKWLQFNIEGGGSLMVMNVTASKREGKTWPQPPWPRATVGEGKARGPTGALMLINILVSYPTRWSFSFILGPLHWSSSWQWQPSLWPSVSGFIPQKQPGKLTLGVFRIYWVTQ